LYRILITLFLILITSCARAEISPTPRSTMALTPILLTNTPEPSVTYTASPVPTPSPTFTPTMELSTYTPTPTSTAMPSLATRMLTVMTVTGRATVEAPQSAYDPVSLAWFYIQPSGGVPCSNLVPMFNFFIGTKGRETCRDTVRSLGRDFGLMYLRFDGIQDLDRAFDNPDATCTRTPFGNQVAYKRGDVCQLREIAQDWALRRPDGSLIRTAGDFIMMDPANLSWRAYFIERAMEMQTIYGWNGLFLDNVSASMNNVGLPLRDYPDDLAYQNAIADFLATIRLAFDDRPVWGNMIFQTTSSVWYRYGEHLDGQMEESAFLNWSSGYLSATQWRNQLTRIETTIASGVDVILVSQGARIDNARQQFAFASYLLIAAPGIHWRYSQDGAGYSEIWDYNNYALARRLGRPLTDRYVLPDGSWERRFEYGVVTANPVTRVGTITVINP
jgi:hypothetical protein